MEILNTLRNRIGYNALKKGFYQDEKQALRCLADSNEKPQLHESVHNAYLCQKLALIHTEVAEITQALRKGKYCYESWNIDNLDDITFVKEYDKQVKDTIQQEVAGAMIRLFDFADAIGMNIDKYIDLEMRYNSLRPKMHGKLF